MGTKIKYKSINELMKTLTPGKCLLSGIGRRNLPDWCKFELAEAKKGILLEKGKKIKSERTTKSNTENPRKMKDSVLSNNDKTENTQEIQPVNDTPKPEPKPHNAQKEMAKELQRRKETEQKRRYLQGLSTR